MKFYGNGVVWDSANNRRLVKFANGEAEVTDKRIQGELIRLGYKHSPVASNPATAEMSMKQLRELGREKGITFPVGTTKADMVTAITK